MTTTRRLKVRRDRVGVHAFDRATGLNVLFDEVAVSEQEWADAPRPLAIALTNTCDLRCSYCYAAKYHAVLDPERVLGWLREVDAAGCLSVGFGGGEPTTLGWFAELCREVTSQTELAVSFTTHGHRLSDDLLDALAGSVHMVRVSVDGIGRTYERRRRSDRAREVATTCPRRSPEGPREALRGEFERRRIAARLCNRRRSWWFRMRGSHS